MAMPKEYCVVIGTEDIVSAIPLDSVDKNDRVLEQVYGSYVEAHQQAYRLREEIIDCVIKYLRIAEMDEEDF